MAKAKKKKINIIDVESWTWSRFYKERKNQSKNRGLRCGDFINNGKPVDTITNIDRDLIIYNYSGQQFLVKNSKDNST